MDTTSNTHHTARQLHDSTHTIASVVGGRHPTSQPWSIHTKPAYTSTYPPLSTHFRQFPRTQPPYSSSQPSTLNTWSVRNISPTGASLIPIFTSANTEAPQAQPPPRLNRKHRCVPLPSQSPVPPQLHPILRYTPGIPPLLDIDLGVSSEVIRMVRMGNGHLLSRYLNDPATEPGIPSMSILHPQLPWGITVHSSVDRGYVTVGDVLEVIWMEMRKEFIMDVDEEGFMGFIGTGSTRTGTRRERSRRKRLDYLLGKKRFVGLDMIPCDGDTWNMVIL